MCLNGRIDYENPYLHTYVKWLLSGRSGNQRLEYNDENVIQRAFLLAYSDVKLRDQLASSNLLMRLTFQMMMHEVTPVM